MKARLIGTAVLVAACSFAISHAQAPAPAPAPAPAKGAGQRAAGPPKPKRAVIVTGEDSFAGHVWKDTSVALKKILDDGKDFAEVTIQPDPNYIANDEFLAYDLAVLDFRNANPLPQEEKVEANLLKFLGTTRGLVVIHWADGAFPYWPEFTNIVGLSQQSMHDPRGPFTVKIVNSEHPITRGMKDYEADDEMYWDTKIGNKTIVPLAVAHSKIHYADFPMAYELRYKNSWVFATPMGHDVKALEVPGTAELIRRGAAWTVGLLK